MQLMQPTIRPTVDSTVQPTVRPTVQLMVQSTVQPTAHHTTQSTVQPTAHSTTQSTSLSSSPETFPTIQHTYQERYQETRQLNNTRKRWIPTRKSRFGDIDKWESFFNEYRSVHASKVNTQKKVVYLKRGTTGIAGQMIGICDSLFVAMMTDRALQCEYHSLDSFLVSSDVITDKYFNFPLQDMFIPFNNTMKSLFLSSTSFLEQIQTYVPPRFKHKYKYYVSGVDVPDPFPNPSRSFNGDGAILIQTLHVMADRFLGRRYNSYFMERIGLLKNRMVFPEDRINLYFLVDLYYNRCIHTLFQPTPLIQKYLNEYEQQLGQGIRIGVHLRMGAGHSDWRDSRQFLTPKRFDKFLGMLTTLIKDQREKHGKNVPVRIFLSTDSTNMERTMQKVFPGLIVTTKGFKRSHVGGVKATKYDDSSIMKAILDVMLLGKCEYLFLTIRSGFSKIGLYYAEENTSFRLVWDVCLNTPLLGSPLTQFVTKSLSMDDENYQQQQDEICALEAIYAEKFIRCV